MSEILEKLPDSEKITPLDKSSDEFAAGENILLRQAILRNKSVILGSFAEAILADHELEDAEQQSMISQLPNGTVAVSEVQFEGDGVIGYSLNRVDSEGKKIYWGDSKS